MKNELFGEMANDANILNKAFYAELLYILGLEETKHQGKIIITQSKASKAGAKTLYNAILDKLESTQQDFDNALRLIILWLNRILFLKLIEANLVRFNNDKSLKFLHLDKVPNFKALSSLFFEILAKKHKDRVKDHALDYLPYLNSSLFEKQDCETTLLDIADLDDNALLDYFQSTQIKDKNAKKKQGKTPLLSYIFEFLDSFDFGSGDNDEVATKVLINSAVLGLVFEKLNGYKDGSFYTPNFITSYMCRDSLQRVVIERFKEFGINAPDLDTLKAQILTNINADFSFKDKAINLLRSIKICDPSVGSGHFLVSALNEMIYIYYKLGLLEFSCKDLTLLNDEVLITTTNGKPFEYIKLENHHIQRALFHLKKSIIENNLFGVDINENSCEITKLRLWIELLKNAYYLSKDDEGYDDSLKDNIHQMQTLPNIDINIKCGNSLTSYFDLGQSLIPATGDFKDFDLIIGNPPYVRQEKIRDLKPQLEQTFEIYCGTADLYTYFFELGLRVLKPNGILSLITSNKFCRANYGAKLREYLLKHSIISFIDLNGIKVFESASVDTCIITIAKSAPSKEHKICYMKP